jgi:hypothetical protein
VPEDIVGRLFGELAGADLPVPPTGAVIARGRQRRRRTRATAAVAAAAAVALVIAGVSQLAGARTRTPAPADHGRRPKAACTAVPDSELTAELAHRVDITAQVIALSPGGTLAYADVTVPGFHGIAEQRVGTGAIVQRIDQVPASDTRASGALSADGELIWTNEYNTHGDQGSGGSTAVRLWSPHTRKVRTLEPAGQSGTALSTPVLFANRGKLAAWLQTDGRRQEIVEANLGTGAVDVIAVGYLGPPVFAGDALVWSVAPSATAPASHLVAMAAGEFPARHYSAVPRALRSAGPGALMGSSSGYWTRYSLIASNGEATAYFSADLSQLFYSPSLTEPARLVLRLPANVLFSPNSLAVGDGFLTWSTDSAASYVASISSLAVATITNGTTEYGSVDGFGGYVLVESTPTPKHGTPKVSLISGSTIDGLVCAASRPAGR